MLSIKAPICSWRSLHDTAGQRRCEAAATLDIGEKGTVASAATAVGVEATAGHVLPPQVRFDRPYLLVVTDRTTGEPLFMARVADPAAR